MTTPTIDLTAWQGRTDAVDGQAGRRWHQVVQPLGPAARDPGTVLLGFACDAGVARNHGRVGAAAGPQALRRHLANLAWHGAATARLYDAGDVTCDGDALESAQATYADRLAVLLRQGHRVVGLGGGHEIAWASYQGIASALAGDPRLRRLGVINFDAHFDLRRPEVPGRGSSGTPFLQIAEARAAAGLPFDYLCLGISAASNTQALFERAAALGTRFVLDVDIGAAATDSTVREFIDGCDAVYCTFCLDALPASVAPAVSAPSGFGVPLHRALELLRLVLAECRRATHDKLVMADVAEFNPGHDAPDARTARTAARIVYELAALSR
ncbi:MAG TPA: formimidoylglutamase [Steroidobacteraceae bacterium]